MLLPYSSLPGRSPGKQVKAPFSPSPESETVDEQVKEQPASSLEEGDIGEQDEDPLATLPKIKFPDEHDEEQPLIDDSGTDKTEPGQAPTT